MRKLLSILLSVTMLAGLAGCNAETAPEQTNKPILL